MGTGVWNANGYVPAQLSAWCRYYLGWEDAVELHHSAEDLVIDHFLNHQEGAIRLYKLPISNTEYFFWRIANKTQTEALIHTTANPVQLQATSRRPANTTKASPYVPFLTSCKTDI
jgi:hypothetical protein